jgi:hypothetical protein
MAGSDDKVPVLGSDGSVNNIDCDALTVGGQTVKRERDRVSGAAADELADVRKADPAPSDYGLVVRPAESVYDRVARSAREAQALRNSDAFFSGLRGRSLERYSLSDARGSAGRGIR